MRTGSRWHRFVPAFALVVLLAASGCVSADEGPTALGDTADGAQATEAFCDAALRLGNPGEPDVDWETATEEEIAEAEQVFLDEVVMPILDDLRELGPQAIQGDVETLGRVISDADGDLGAAWFTGEGGSARTAIADRAGEDCGWTDVSVLAVDYAYEGIPDTLDPGTAVLSFTNGGQEPHEMVVFRKNDGVTLSAAEFLELPEDQATQNVTFTGAAYAPSGESSSVWFDLAAGDYLVMCFIPVGSTVGGEEADGPPHATRGMVAEFTVG